MLIISENNKTGYSLGAGYTLGNHCKSTTILMMADGSRALCKATFYPFLNFISQGAGHIEPTLFLGELGRKILSVKKLLRLANHLVSFLLKMSPFIEIILSMLY